MDSEHAETYLRLLAESELRRARPDRTDAAAGRARAHDVASAFAAIGILDRELAQSIVDTLDAALEARAPGHSPGPRPLGGPAVGMWARRRVMAARMAVARVPRTVGPVTVSPCGQVLRLDDTDVYVLAVIKTPARTWLSVAARTWHGQPLRALHGGPRPPVAPGPSGFPPHLTATDAAGNGYKMRLAGGGGGDNWFHGQAELTPVPPAGTAWLDIGDGGRPVRIDLTARPPQASVASTPMALGPGAAYLHGQAESLLASRRPVIGGELARLAALVPPLGTVGALPQGTVTEGRLRWLCERFGVTGHGLTSPAAEPPEHWASVLASRDSRGERRGTVLMPDSDLAEGPVATADLVVALPEIDGLAIALAGLITMGDHTSMHGVYYSTGTTAADPDDDFPACWLRDDSGQWHATWRRSWGGELNGMHRFRSEVIPALPPTASSAEVLIAGRAAELRAHVPLTWRAHG